MPPVTRKAQADTGAKLPFGCGLQCAVRRAPQRDADVADWAADVIGAAAGSSLYRLINEVIKLEAGGWGAGG